MSRSAPPAGLAVFAQFAAVDDQGVDDQNVDRDHDHGPPRLGWDEKERADRVEDHERSRLPYLACLPGTRAPYTDDRQMTTGS